MLPIVKAKLIRPNGGAPFATVRDSKSGIEYTIAEPGATYEIECTIVDGINSSGTGTGTGTGTKTSTPATTTATGTGTQLGGDRMHAFFRVDGGSLNRAHRFYLACATGKFACDSRIADGAFKTLKFGSSVPAAGNKQPDTKEVRSDADLKSIGQITIAWQRCICSDGLHSLPDQSAPQAVLPGTKKFHEFSGASTVTGVVVPRPPGQEAGEAKCVWCYWNSTFPEGRLKLRYDTVSSLMIKGILIESNPEHKRIIDADAGARSGGSGGGDSRARPSAALKRKNGSTAGAKAVSKSGGSGGGGGGGGGGADSDTDSGHGSDSAVTSVADMELKAAIDASLRSQRRAASKQSASCDLTGSGSDDEAVWRAVPKKKKKLSAAAAASAVKIEDD